MTNTTAPVNPSEVGWQFVPQYYTFVNKHPGRLHCFYTKTSTFIHGTEGEEGKPCYGQAVSTILKSLLPQPVALSKIFATCHEPTFAICPRIDIPSSFFYLHAIRGIDQRLPELCHRT